MHGNWYDNWPVTRWLTPQTNQPGVNRRRNGETWQDPASRHRGGWLFSCRLPINGCFNSVAASRTTRSLDSWLPDAIDTNRGSSMLSTVSSLILRSRCILSALGKFCRHVYATFTVLVYRLSSIISIRRLIAIGSEKPKEKQQTMPLSGNFGDFCFLIQEALR